MNISWTNDWLQTKVKFINHKNLLTHDGEVQSVLYIILIDISKEFHIGCNDLKDKLISYVATTYTPKCIKHRFQLQKVNMFADEQTRDQDSCPMIALLILPKHFYNTRFRRLFGKAEIECVNQHITPWICASFDQIAAKLWVPNSIEATTAKTPWSRAMQCNQNFLAALDQILWN